MAIDSSGQQHPTVAILGAGSWGATLSWLLASNGRDIRLWSHDQQKARLLNQKRKLERPLTVDIPRSVSISADLTETVEAAQVVVICCQSQAMRAVAKQLLSALPAAGQNPVLVNAAKGLELSSLKRMSQVIAEILPDTRVCTLSGPNLAPEILLGLPAASVVASTSAEAALIVQRALMVPIFRLYTSADLPGVELGGTLKNVIAIAAGCSDGLSLGANAKAALLTRGLAEMTRLAVALGAKPLTLAGLSGMGDLFATCTSNLSRNYRLGLTIAQGASPQQAIDELGATAEGVPTAAAVCELSKKLGLELPIAEQVNATLKGTTTPRGAIMTLMTRPPGSEW